MKKFIKNLLKICYLPATLPVACIISIICIATYLIVWPFQKMEYASIADVLCLGVWISILPDFRK